jgi:hypothetical protein
MVRRPSRFKIVMSDQHSTSYAEVEVSTTEIGTDKYQIVATATFESNPEEIWKLLGDWEQFLAIGLPGITSDFQWLSGGPDQVPSTFQFEMAGTVIREEIYEIIKSDRHRLRYRTLEPALGVLDYDAILDLDPISGFQTNFTAAREVQFEPGFDPGILAGMVHSETQYLKDYFAGKAM